MTFLFNFNLLFSSFLISAYSFNEINPGGKVHTVPRLLRPSPATPRIITSQVNFAVLAKVVIITQFHTRNIWR